MTNTNTKNNKAVSTYLTWSPADQLNAHLRSADHKESWSFLTGLSHDAFSQYVSDILLNIQPLTLYEQKAMIASVKSSDRLRLAFHTKCLLDHYIEAMTDTQEIEVLSSGLQDLDVNISTCMEDVFGEIGLTFKSVAMLELEDNKSYADLPA
jgi:hypothetical protein